MSLKITLDMTAETKRYFDMASKWDVRARAYKRHIVYSLAKRIYKDVEKRIPSEAEELLKSLQLAQINTKNPAYLVRIQAVSQTVEADEEDQVILEVVAKSGPVVTPARTRLLIDYSPWTLDTIPYTPDPRFATVIKRKVSPMAVRGVRMDRKRDRSWRRIMFRVGIRPAQAKSREAGPIKAMSDLRLQSVTYEFGLTGVYKPHWRPAITKNMRGLALAVKKDRNGRKIMNDPRYQGWRKQPKMQHHVNQGDLKTYEGFQKTLGIL